MSVSSLPSAMLVGRFGSAGGRALQNVALGIFACLVTATALYWIVVTIAEQNHREAARMIVAAQKGDTYWASITSAMAASQGRQRGF